jgi:hypothetical protein
MQQQQMQYKGGGGGKESAQSNKVIEKSIDSSHIQKVMKRSNNKSGK